MILNKWNYDIHDYEPYEVPDDWNCKTYSVDMEEVVNCPQCGKKILFGDGYTSLEVHTDMGFGYAVCEQCYEKEWNRRKKVD
jgi:hypothetical protein